MRHVSPKESECTVSSFRKHPSAPRIQRVIFTPEASERDTCPRVPNPLNHIREPCEYDACPEDTLAGSSPGCSRARHVSRVAEPREPLPGALRVGHAPRTPPGALRVPQPESPTPRDYPGHSASMPRVPGSVSLPAYLENTQKIFKTLEMHHKSNFDPKNVIPIFMALYYSVLPRKNTKPGKKTKLPLGKTSESKLCLFVSGRSLRPKFMKIYY